MGQAALCTLVFTERFANITKRTNELLETNKSNTNTTNSANTTKKVSKIQSDDDMEMEMGMSAARDADHEKRFLQSTEYDITLNESNLLSKFHPFIAYIAANESGQYTHNMLRHTSTLALCRYMSVSSMLSEQYLPLLFTILEKDEVSLAPTTTTDTPNTPTNPTSIQSKHASQLRTTIMICLGDLAFRFPNALEPWTHRMYNRLSDTNPTVRYNSLMVLTHLVLNDMIKVKGQVVHVVMCIGDSSDVIQDLARLLFTELSKRSNNPIYNLMGDIIGKLSATAGLSDTSSGTNGTNGNGNDTLDTTNTTTTNANDENQSQDDQDGVVVASLASLMATDPNTNQSNQPEDPLRLLTLTEFKSIMSFLLKFVHKDKQADGLAERLITRMGSSTSIRQKRLLAYCINQLAITEKGVKKMVEMFRYVYMY